VEKTEITQFMLETEITGEDRDKPDYVRDRDNPVYVRDRDN